MAKMGPKIKLTYFQIEAAAEKVRLAFVMTGTEFEDCRVPFPEWAALKPTTPYGQLPIMEVDDGGAKTTLAQSNAMMKWACRKFDTTDTLYPSDPDKLLAVEEAIGLIEDMQRAWQPALYLGMGMHQNFGHPEEWPEKAATVQKLREKFIAEGLPKFMVFFTAKLEKTPFLCGDKMTAADLVFLPQLRYFTKGVADHVPADCLNAYPVITAYVQRCLDVPQIKAWYKL